MRAHGHIVTVYNSQGETGRRAAWSRSVLAGVRLQVSSASAAAMGGREERGGATLYVPGSLAGYVAPGDFTGAPGSWTLRDGDMIAEGISDEPAPPAGALRVTGVEAARDAAGRVHHLKAAAS